ETLELEVAQHPRRPAGPGSGGADVQLIHTANLNTTVSRFARAGSPVAFFEPNDVVQVRRRDLEDRRVRNGRDPVDRPRPVPEAVAGTDLTRDELSVRLPQLESRVTVLDVPRLVLDPVVLEAQRLARLHEQN